MSFRRMRHVKAREVQGCQIAFDAARPTMYDATSGGSLVAADGAVARWEDVSGNGKHATQGTSGARPLRKASSISGLDSVLFDGSDDSLAFPTVDVRPSTLVYVGQRVATQTGYITMFCMNAGGFYHRLNSSAALGLYPGSDLATSLNPSNNQTFAIAVVSKTGDLRAYGNASSATIASSSNSQTGPAYNNTIGSEGAARYSNHRACEAMVWNLEIPLAVNQRMRHSRLRKWRFSA